MHPLEDYTLGKCLYTDAHSELFAAVRDSDGRRVVLKTYPGEGRSSGRSRARREFEALTSLSGPGIVQGLELIERSEGPVLVLDAIEGVSLREWLDGRPPSDGQLADVAIQITQALMRVHAVGWLHRDLRPEHIWIDPASLRVQLAGFGQACPFGTALDRNEVRARSKGKGAMLLFIAPEQTGRMGRGVDGRSDLYGLGATLYYALTGVPPFEGDDPLALVHAHMARLPISPLERRPRTSPTLARIVMKLLQKQPEDRYQTASALEHDLGICREQLLRSGRIDDDLPLGTADFPVRPLFRRSLYGRDAEIAELEAAYMRAVQGGSELVFLRGVAGAGKSTLVQELRRMLSSTGGYLATGKFDHYGRDVPYAGLSTAFSALLDQIFTEPETHVARWQSDLSGSLGGLAGAAVELIPELELLLGDVPPAPALGPSETRTRLALAVQRFVKGCGTADHPLVLFLDDIQWADPGTLELIESLVLHGEARYLLVVVAYREEEVGDDHPVTSLCARVAGPNARSLALGGISLDDAAAMVADALGRTAQRARDLAAAVVRKTGGVPFLIQQFTLHLHAAGIIHFKEHDGWVWDLAAVEAAEIPEGAVGLMVAKLQRLEAEARAVLQFASCVSNEFDVPLLEELSDRPRPSLELALRAVADEGLIAPSSGGFRFVHDRVREAAQAMLSAEEQARVHFGVAEHLLGKLDAEALQARIFEVLEHLNHGLALVPDSLRLRVVELNTEAGRRSLAAGAAATASKYLATARRSFQQLNASEHRELDFELAMLSSDCAFRTGDTKSALELLEPLQRHPLSRIQSARVIGLRVQVYSVTRPPIECVRYSLSELRKFGVRWSLRPSHWRVALAVHRVQRIVRQRGDQDFLVPAATFDLDKLATFLLIDLTGASLAQANARFATLAACHVLSDYLRHGYIARAGFTLAAYAVFSFVIHRDAEQAARIGRLALECTAREPDPLWDSRTEFQIHALLHPWLRSRRETTVALQKTLERMWELGDTEFIYHSDSMILVHDLLGGSSVPEIDARLAKLGSVAAGDLRYTDFLYFRRAYRPLVEQRPEDVRLDIDVFGDDIPRGVGFESNEPVLRTVWLMVLSMYGHWGRVLAESDAGLSTLYTQSPWCHIGDYAFYRGLAAYALAGKRRSIWSRTRRVARQARRELERLARHGPDFVHMAEILDAEHARSRGDHARARALYQSAAQHAVRQQFVHHAALAHERHASMMRELRRETEAAQCLSQAITCYAEWGARAKAEALKRTLG